MIDLQKMLIEAGIIYEIHRSNLDYLIKFQDMSKTYEICFKFNVDRKLHMVLVSNNG